MSSTRLALNVVACAALGIMFWAACAGIGFRIVPGRRSGPAEDGPASWRQPGVAACVGLAALMALGGVGVLFEIPWWAIVIPFVTLGLAFSTRDVVELAIRRRPARPKLIVGACAAVALVIVALIQALVGFRFPYAACDDLRAYLPMAHRLLDTNGLIEPWSTRRLQNLGGFTFLEALPVSVFGDMALGTVETMLAGIFLAGLFVANGTRSTWARVLGVVFILAIPLLWVPRSNATGVLIGTPLLVAAFACTAELRVSLSASRRASTMRWAAAGGLLVAALLSVRPPVSVLAALVLAAGAASAGKRAWRARAAAVSVAVGTLVIAIAPWALATWKSSGVLLYQVPTGNQNARIVANPPIDGIVNLLARALDLVRAGPYPWVALGVLLVALAARRIVPDPWLLAVAAMSTGVVLFGFGLSIPFASRLAFLRYVAPLAQGLVVFCICEVVRGADQRSQLAATRKPLRSTVLVLAASLALGVVAFSVIGVSIETEYLPGGPALVRVAIDNKQVVLPPLRLSIPGLDRTYRRALRHLDPQRTIAAVDRPYLIDYSRYDIPSLDLPGFAAPGGTFPFFTGAVPKIAKLRNAGYKDLLVTIPDFDSCIAPFAQREVRRQRLAPYSRWARYNLDWDEDIAEIASKAPHAVQRFGPLLVIDLPQAQRELSKG